MHTAKSRLCVTGATVLAAMIIPSVSSSCLASARTDNGSVLGLALSADLYHDKGADVEVRVNGELVGSVTVSSTRQTVYSLPLAHSLDSTSTVDIRFTNDDFGSDGDRNLHVAYIQSGSYRLVPTGANSKIDLGNTWTTATDGEDLVTGGTDVVSNGALRLHWSDADEVVQPNANANSFPLTLYLGSSACDGVRGDVEVRVNGIFVQNIAIDSDSISPYSVQLQSPLQLHDSVDVRFVNDASDGTQDRNVTIARIDSNGHSMVPGATNSSIDLGDTWSTASDGYDTKAGTPALVSNGTLRIRWDAPAPTGVIAPSIVDSNEPSNSSVSPTSKLSNSSLPGHQVWGHFLGYGLPNWDQLTGGRYGDSYYLDLVHGDQRTAARPTAGVPRATAAGFTGMQIIQNHGTSGTDYLADWMSQADPTWTDAQPNNDFSIAPTFADPTLDDFVRMARNYVNFAQGHASASKVDGRYVIYVYGARNHMSAQDWADARAQLRSSGAPVYVIGDLGEDVVWHNWKIPAAEIAPYLPNWDAAWTFETNTAALMDQIVPFLNAHDIPYAGGMAPGYDRETTDPATTVDPEGTAKFRREWKTALASGSNWQNLVTYNDLAEDTEVDPTSNWSVTRSDINAFYSAQSRGISYPHLDAQLYVTTPKAIRVGEPVKAEGMVLNGSRSTVTVITQLVDSDGRQVGQAVRNVVAPSSSGDATTEAVPVDAIPVSGYYRAVATSYAQDGTVLQKVTSAPVVVYGKDVQPTNSFARTYYSVPARLAYGGTVHVSLAGDPAEGPQDASVSASTSDRFRFVELDQNTRLVERGYDSTALQTRVPLLSDQLVGGQSVTDSPHGYYVGRVIDDTERVGYSDPVRVP